MFRPTRLLLAFLALGLLVFLRSDVRSQKREDPSAPKAGHVAWEGWTFQWSVRKREGLVITDVTFRGRTVLKYAGLAELLTAYDQGQPRPRDFDQGYQIITLVPGADCSSGESCKVFDIKGRASGNGVPAQVMLHEERTGPNYLGGLGRVPGKTLVLWMGLRFTGGHDGYTFLVRWKFRDDGTLIPEVGATGVPQHLATGATSSMGAFIGVKTSAKQGAPIADAAKVFAPSHVHGFLYRLDFDVDGEENVVEEFNWERQTDPKKPPSAKCTWTPILKETGRPCNPETFRSWRVVNHNAKNALGHSRSYHLIPGNTGMFRGSARLEPAAQADLWVTLYKPNELGGMEALPTYVNDEPVENKNVVLWYWLTLHHFPRSEDWLRQPMIWKSFELMPRDFLDESPLSPEKQ